MFFCSCDFIFNFFPIFSKIRHSISTLPVILSFIKFCVARTFLVERHLDVVRDLVGRKITFSILKFTNTINKISWHIHSFEDIQRKVEEILPIYRNVIETSRKSLWPYKEVLKSFFFRVWGLREKVPKGTKY